MKRLTKKEDSSGFYFYPQCFQEPCNGGGYSERCNKCDINHSVSYKLGQYEDTELTPEDITILKNDHTKLKDFEATQSAKLLIQVSSLNKKLMKAIGDIDRGCDTCLYNGKCAVKTICEDYGFKYWIWRGSDESEEAERCAGLEQEQKRRVKGFE